MKKKIFLILILFLAGFLRFYKIPQLMNFGGDIARDFIVARDITLKKDVPLVGCPSSVPWLHQGTLFIYLLAPVLLVGQYNPIIGGYFVSLLGILGVLGIYVLGKKMFDDKTGFWAAFFYAASPLIVYFDRLPYHQSLISLFTILFIYLVFLSISGEEKYFIWSFFVFGLLMQLELSNIALILVLITCFIWKRKNISLSVLLFSMFAFLITWIPKIIFDIKEGGFTQTLGFGAWILHKILPFNIPGDNPSARFSFSRGLLTIQDGIGKIIFWQNSLIAFCLFLLSLIFFVYFIFRKRKQKENLRSEKILILWFSCILVFTIQGTQNVAYFTVIFGAVALLFGYLINLLPKKIFKIISFVFICLFVYNGYFLISSDFFVIADEHSRYTIDNAQSYSLFYKMAGYVSQDAKSDYNLVALGTLAEFSSNLDTFNYLTWYLKNPPSTAKQDLKYYIYYNFDGWRYNFNNESKIRKFPYMTIVKIGKIKI